MNLPVDFADQMYRDAISCDDDDQVKHIFDVMFSGGPHGVEECDRLLASLDVSLLSIDQILSLLTSTQHVRGRMSERSGFIRRAESWMELTGFSKSRIRSLFSGYEGSDAIQVPFLRFPNGVVE